MGCCFSVQLPCDQVLGDAVNKVTEFLCLQASYIYNIEKNLKDLEETMEDLKAKRNDLSGKVEREEYKGLRRTDEVKLWLSKVETIESEVKDLLNLRTMELQRLCFCGLCSKNYKLSYTYGKQIFDMLEKVKEEKAKGVFEEVAEQVRVSEVVEKQLPPNIVGQEAKLIEAFNRLTVDGVGLLGLHGMGGVGKTTLLEQINNKFIGSAFDIVILVVVSKGSTDVQIQKVQEAIAKKIGCDGEDWKRKNEVDKASDIFNVLKKKKFVLLLDDLWEKVDLRKIGVPFPDRENGCKVVFTTRSLEVCGCMVADSEMEVQCLSPEDALDLFRKKVGEITLGKHPDIPKLAEDITKKCHGLPLALSIIGEAMSFKRNILEWQNAIKVLNSNATEFPHVKDRILPLLKYSYDNLMSEQAQKCLLYCALFQEDERILKDELIEKWICEGIIDDSESMHEAHNEGNMIIFNLVRSSLLMMEEIHLDFMHCTVYMHDIVREMALWIASDFGKQKDNFVVHAGDGLCKMPKLKNWNAVKKLSLMNNNIDHISSSVECLQLTTLMLQRNKISLGNISGEFFKSMLMLVVLDLSDNEALSELPNEISKLVSLKYLNISTTGLECLPAGLLKLKNLIHLNLECTEQLLSIIGISALLNLRVLKLLDSGVVHSSKTMEELKVLEHLEILTISFNSDSGLDEFLKSQNLMCSSQILAIKGCHLESSDIWCLARMEKLHQLLFIENTISEIKMDTASILEEMVSPQRNPKNAFFLSLSEISLICCKFTKDLTWLMFAPNLTALQVSYSEDVEEIIDKEKASIGEALGIVPFQKLEWLQLHSLPELKNIYWTSLLFPCLMDIVVTQCPKLKKLPLNSKSGKKGLTVDIDKEWLKGFEWEDDATKARFLPL